MRISRKKLKQIIREEYFRLTESSLDMDRAISADIEGQEEDAEVDMTAAGRVAAAEDDLDDELYINSSEYRRAYDAEDRYRQSLGLNEGVLYVTKGPYGMSVSANSPDPHSGDGEFIAVGDMVLALLAAGDDDIFQAPQGVDPQALQKLNQKHAEKVQGGMQRWDADVFEQYYNVDNDRVVRLYAKLMNHTIEEIPYED